MRVIITISLEVKMVEEKPVIEEGYIDEVGGYHANGVGYDPKGEFCGECCRESCKGCTTVKGRNTSMPKQAQEFITSRFEKVI